MLDVTEGFIVVLDYFGLFVSDITNGLIVSFATCCCDMLLYCICFVCQVDSVSWDTEIQDDVGLHMHRRTGAGGTAPVRFSLCVMQWQ